MYSPLLLPVPLKSNTARLIYLGKHFSVIKPSVLLEPKACKYTTHVSVP